MQKLWQNNEEENLKVNFTQKTNLEYPIPLTNIYK